MVRIVNSTQKYSDLRLRLSHHHQNWLISIMCITIQLFYICLSQLIRNEIQNIYFLHMCFQFVTKLICASLGFEFCKNICMYKLISRIHTEHKYSLESFAAISLDSTLIFSLKFINGADPTFNFQVLFMGWQRPSASFWTLIFSVKLVTGADSTII